MKILVADETQGTLATITSTLKKLGHEVVPATSGADAVSLYQKTHPDLVILDTLINGMGAFECAKKIREIKTDEWIPIIFICTSVDDESITKGVNAGGDDFLIKPFSDLTLATKINVMQRIVDMREKLLETGEKLFLLSSTDSLTGVYNRAQFDGSLKEMIASADHYHHMLALLFIDLDNFKNINDSFGHHVGDLLLQDVARRLKSCTRAVDFVARLGGDEFAVVLGEIKSKQEAEDIAKKMINAVSFDYVLEGHNIRIGTSIGVAFYPDKGTTSENLLMNADVAMYHAKTSGRNNYQVFTKELEDKYKQQISLEHALKFALERNELYLTYQPIFKLDTKELVGLETLICWEHPKFGLVSPSIFIPLAEETGLITHIGNWVLETACEQANHWSLNEFKNFKFAVNLSSRQLIHGDFYKHLMEVMCDCKFNVNQLELELTETIMMTYGGGPFSETIKKLHEAGVSISIDDFGTGYSSLIRLKHLPISTMKIEKSFVQDAVKNQNGDIIVSCLIALGKNLGLNVIAEGIETEQELKFLIAKGCPQGQGFYLSKPLTADNMSKFLIEALNKSHKVKG